MGDQMIRIVGEADTEETTNKDPAAPADEYKSSYLALFTATSKALEAINAQNYGTAKELLVAGQQKAEELYLKAGEK